MYCLCYTDSQGSISQSLVMLSKLTSAISVKQKMIDELAEKQRNAKRMTQQYDQHLSCIEQAIREMQARRDRELAKLGALPTVTYTNWHIVIMKESKLMSTGSLL